MKAKIKLVILYQVIMHYRLPFYEKISSDNDYNFSLLYGKSANTSKNTNTDLSNSQIKATKVKSFRIPFNLSHEDVSIPFSPILLFSLIKRSPHVILTEGASSLINSSIAFIYAKIFRKKYIWWSLGKLANREYTGVRKLIDKWIHFIEKRSDAIFTYSTQGKLYYLDRGVEKSKIFVAVNVLNTNQKLKEIEYCRPEKKGYDDFFNLSFIGSITEHKNITLLIDLLEKFNAENNNIGRLHIIGDGDYMPKVKEYIRGKGIDEFVILHGRINKGANMILENCDVMILPGLGGLAICEAMLSSLPIITGVADGTELDLVDDKNGFILNEMTLGALYHKVSLLHKDPKLREQMGKESYRKITQIYNFDNYYKVFKNAVNFVLKKHPK